MNAYPNFTELIGKHIVTTRLTGDQNGWDTVTFDTTDGKYVLRHEQDCCESVYLLDFAGDLEDLQDATVLGCEESYNHDDTPPLPGWYDATCKWTFYRIQTNKGPVTLRWFGSSNGYYGDEVSFVKIG